MPLNALLKYVRAGRWPDGLKEAQKIFEAYVWDAANLGPDVPFRKPFTSTEQTITAAGALTLPHSLSASPELIQCRLICKTAELGYSIGDEVITSFTDLTNTLSRGVSIVPDVTNINVRYGSNASSLNVINKTTGDGAGITNANWKLIVKAWA